MQPTKIKKSAQTPMAKSQVTDASVQKASDDTCHRCGQASSSGMLCVANYKFHEEHFTCYQCNCKLQGSKFYHKMGEFYCSDDYVDKFCHTCRHCHHKIKGGSVIEAFGGYYHPEHFVCVVCERPFQEEKYYDLDNRPYCFDHFHAATQKSCAGCSQKLTEKDDTVKVNNQNFHSNCLHCARCQQSLAREKHIFQKQGKVYCRRDYLSLFCHRCTFCGEYILKHCITVNNEFYHSDCLSCSVCKCKLKKYICIRGHLRCAEHAAHPTPVFDCSVCSEKIQGETIIQASGLTVHPECFTCNSCGANLRKSTCRRLHGKLVCQMCVLSVETSASRNRETPTNETPRSSTSETNFRSNRSSTSSHSGSSRGNSRSNSRSGSPSNSLMSTESDSKHKERSDSDGSISNASIPRRSTNPRRRSGGHRRTSSTQIKRMTSMNKGQIDWRKGELIGKGSFGKVYMGMNALTGELLAVKRIKISTEEDQQQAAQIEAEISLLDNLRHQNIVSFIATQKNGQFLDIIMEYVPGKSLDTLLERFGAFSEKIVKNYTKQLLTALAYCHQHNVVHRDIKGKNILLDAKGNLKLADFGSAKRFNAILSKDAPSMNYNYTPLWTAPEVLVGEYNMKVDVWSAGCVCIEMATGLPPWSEEKFDNPFRALYHIGNTDTIPKFPPDFSELGKSFLTAALTRDPDRRPSAEQLLTHEWLADVESTTMSFDVDDEDDEDSDDDSDM